MKSKYFSGGSDRYFGLSDLEQILNSGSEKRPYFSFNDYKKTDVRVSIREYTIKD
jgi:hypothetical protein